MNENFIYNSIRRYNQVSRDTQKAVILYRIGVHVGLIEKKRSLLPELSVEERSRVIYFVNQFLKNNGFTNFIQ